MFCLHATTVAFQGRAVLLRGPSGCGKSDLALRLIDHGAVLVADDQTCLTCENGILTAAPLPQGQGLMEVRNVGILRFPWQGDVPVCLDVDLDPAAMRERLPDPTVTRLLDVEVPCLRLPGFEASAPLKILAWVTQAVGA